MIIIPAVDLKNGKCVQLVQGEPGTEQVVIDNPDKVAFNKVMDMGITRPVSVTEESIEAIEGVNQ